MNIQLLIKMKLNVFWIKNCLLDFFIQLQFSSKRC